LDWIVMKALEKDRNGRYATANSFAQDIQRYLADEPVLACPPSAWYRLRKLARRNKVPLLTAAVVAVALVLGTVVSVWQAIRATEANRRIQANLELSLAALDEVYLSVLEARLPRELETDPENQDLLIKALGFYEKFAERNQADPAVWREVAKAYNRAAVLHSRLGHYDQMLATLDRAAEVVARLIVDSPADTELKRMLAEIHLRKGDAYLLQRELVNEGSHQAKAAQVEYQKGIDLLEPLIEKSALGPKCRATFADLHDNLSLCFQKDGDLEKAEKYRRQAIKIRAHTFEEVDDLATKLFYIQQLSFSQSNLGVILNMTGRVDEAEKVNRQAVKLISDVATRAATLQGYKRGRLPGFAEANPVQHDLGHAHYHLGNTLRGTGRSRAAEEEYRQTVTFLAQAVQNWPRVVYYRGFLAWFRRTYGNLLFEGGKRAEASQQYRQSIEIYRKIQKESGRELANADGFIESLTVMGDLLFAEGDRKGASVYYREALDLSEKLAKQNVDFENGLAWFLVACADPNFRKPARALGLARKVVHRSEGKNADHLNTLGVAQYRLGNWKDAVAALEKAKQLHKEKDQADWLFLAMAQWHLGQKQLGRESYNRAIKLLNVYEYPPAESSRWRAEAQALLGLKEPKR
jgi:tetratricopeptide (TPR) repeat protein